VPGLLAVLWDSLLHLDDLSASTNSIMELMGTLLSFSYSSTSSDNSTSHSNSAALGKLVPRLWPFLGHNISSVRRSSLQAIMTLLTLDKKEATSSGSSSDPVQSGSGEGEGKAWLVHLLQPFLCQIFQRFLLEGKQENRKLLQEVGHTGRGREGQ